MTFMSKKIEAVKSGCQIEFKVSDVRESVLSQLEVEGGVQIYSRELKVRRAGEC
jgi:hypothetical protein